MQPGFRLRFIAFLFSCLALSPTAFSLDAPPPSREMPKILKDVGIRENLGTRLDLNAYTLVDETGAKRPLASFFRGKPVIFNFVYFECPNLCTAMLNGLLSSLKLFDWTPGNQFEILTISIDPREGAALAAEKKAKYLEKYARPGAENGWHFLTGNEADVKRLATTIGFGYQWDETEKQYAHSAGIFIATPDGVLSRLLYGISFDAKQLKLSLLEASQGKVGTVVERLLLSCFRYDPNTRTYSFYISKAMQAAGALTVLLLTIWLATFWRKQLALVHAKGESSCSAG